MTRAPRLLLAALLATAPAQAEPLSCPRTLRTAQQALDVPPGLEAEEQPNDWSNLAYVEFYAGPRVPVGRGFAPIRYAVPPASQAIGPRSITGTWDFSAQREEIFLGCHYHGTRVYLLVPVPAPATRCTVTWGRNDAGVAMPGAVQRIECE